MTAPARITQADINRATKAAKYLGTERFRICMDYMNCTIDIIVGEEPDLAPKHANPLDRLFKKNAA